MSHLLKNLVEATAGQSQGQGFPKGEKLDNLNPSHSQDIVIVVDLSTYVDDDFIRQGLPRYWLSYKAASISSRARLARFGTKYLVDVPTMGCPEGQSS
jgi:hypothetical protein